ncbi:MAG TPA: MBL fold metallo-hydrolase [Pirellulales bacterium]|jgi:glyoxylase-like metal-dependent hydrolase (beta-lactamase superfamily II)|nr:MBL fold metallo-hydrolase [Pirellulales bacterium]
MPADKTSLPQVRRFEGPEGSRIYRITCDAFPGLTVHVHLLVGLGPPTIIDAGSGFGEANRQLMHGLEIVRSEFFEPIGLADVQRIIITHGHIDHFGGLSFLHERAPQAEIAIHELDVMILTSFEERVAVAKRAIRRFLQEAGVGAELLADFMDVYGFSKKNVHSLPVGRTLVDNQQLDGLRFIHTPGHCPGQVCIIAGDVIFTADHILPEISPHQAPESIMPYTGLGHYLESLDKVERLGEFRLALGGHQGPMTDLPKRISDIRQGHHRKLDKILTIVRNNGPLTINEISQQLYTHVKGFHVLLALEEVAAHVEYLSQHAKLRIANLDEYRLEENTPVRYCVA